MSKTLKEKSAVRRHRDLDGRCHQGDSRLLSGLLRKEGVRRSHVPAGCLEQKRAEPQTIDYRY